MNLRKAILILILIIVLSVIHLSLYSRNVKLKYEIAGQKNTNIKLQREIRSLNSISAKKKDLNRIEYIAIKKLYMIRPDDITYIKLR